MKTFEELETTRALFATLKRLKVISLVKYEKAMLEVIYLYLVNSKKESDKYEL